MKQRVHLKINHHNASRMEFFLNSLDEDLTEVPYSWQTLKLSNKISGASKFVSSGTPAVSITVFLCNSYHDANSIAKENNFPYSKTARWSLNGDLLYIVECSDEDKVSEVLGVFAGKE